MRAKNRGITFIGFVMLAALLGGALIFGMKVGPMYVEYRSVKGAMLSVQQTPGSAQMSNQNIWFALDKKFNVNYVTSVKRENVFITTQNGKQLRIAYDVRIPLIYNLDIVGKFDHAVTLSNTLGGG